MSAMRLKAFDNHGFSRGRPAIVEALWVLVQALLVSSFIPGSTHRCVLLRLFGARIGRGVVFKPGVRVKFPWKLSVGDWSWIGEDVWIDNLAEVTIGDDCCLSQGAYLCAGSHDWSLESFDLIVKPITLCNGAWVAAMARVAPGVTVGEGAVLALGAIATRDLPPFTINVGAPAQVAGVRRVRAK